MESIREENKVDMRNIISILEEAGRLDTIQFNDTNTGFIFLSLPSKSAYNIINKAFDKNDFRSKYAALKNVFNQVKRKLWLIVEQIEKYGK